MKCLYHHLRLAANTEIRFSGAGRPNMPKWIPCGEKFIIGDVVRWKEAVRVEKGKRKKKLIKVGERRVTAEVLNTDRKGFVCLSVCKCEILANGTRGVMKTRGRM